MSAAANKAVMQEVFAELSKGNARPFVQSLSRDVRWTVIGRTKFSKTYSGRNAFLGELMEPVLAALDGPLEMIVEHVVAEDDSVVVAWRGHGTTKDGKAYDNTYCWIAGFADGKIVELTEYMDTELATAVFGC